MKKLFLFTFISCTLIVVGFSLKQVDATNNKVKIDTKKLAIEQTATKTLVEKAIKNYYGDKSQPILIYNEIPFEDGTLVLAEEFVDGEKYPDLHFVDAKGKVTYLTRGSYCWTLNYTQFRGYNIFFGSAEAETQQHDQNAISVKKVEAIFSDKTESVIPREKIIGILNKKENNAEISEKHQGYIMPVKGNKMPNDLIATLANEKKVSLCAKSIGDALYMPDYFKVNRPDIRNSYAFTFSPMLTPREFEQGYKDGQIYLKGNLDKRGNPHDIYLKLAGFMKQTDSFILPQDIKSLYLSNNDSILEKFSPGEVMEVEYPKQRKVLDCSILKLTKEMVDKEIGQDSLALIKINQKNKIVLPNEKGCYLLAIRTEKENEIQTYTNVFEIN